MSRRWPESWEEPPSFITGEEEKLPCRFCKHADREHIGRGYCSVYPEPNGKPDRVYFHNEPCPKFVHCGEDLLPYDLVTIFRRENSAA
ncbi:MAG: hypothetical protein LBT21_06330 [Oscillospiraceae bacterium]|jgi:hypothetical protein|nr:hypothetical protein [Oscillospiraceae bacterium]